MSRQPHLGAVAVAAPPPVSQDDVRDVALRLHPDLEGTRYLEMFDNAGIRQRTLVQPLEWYLEPHPLHERFTLAVERARVLGAEAGRVALDRAGVDPLAVDAVVVVSTTVLRSPGLDVDLVPALGLRHDVRRLPLFGFASLGGAAGLALAADLVRGGLGHVLVVAAEANSLTFVPGESSPEAVVTMALFSDGAAAAVVSGSAGRVRLVGSHVDLVPDSVDVMGFDPVDTGLRWRLAKDVPEVARANTAASVDAALATVGWRRKDLDHVLLHPGGVRVLEACAEAIGVVRERLGRSYDVLADHGNMSSATVLAVMERLLREPVVEGRGILTAMGPGFAYEHVLFDG